MYISKGGIKKAKLLNLKKAPLSPGGRVLIIQSYLIMITIVMPAVSSGIVAAIVMILMVT